MKKKFIYSFMIAAAAAAFSSCSNFLEERPTDAFDEETAFQSPTLVYVNTVASLYNNMFKIMGNDRHVYDLNTFSAMRLCFLAVLATGKMAVYGRIFSYTVGAR